MVTQTQTEDPFETAWNAEYQPPSRNFFGQVGFDTWFAALVKGSGKVPYDPEIHANERRFTVVDINLYPLPGSPMLYPVTRSMIAESAEWANIVKKSLRDCGVNDPRSINKRWAQIELVPTGRKYESAGVTKDATTIKFLAIYSTEAECQAAADQLFGKANPASEKPAEGENQSRDFAMRFLPALWKSCNGDPMLMAQKIEANALVRRFFTIESPEVLDLIAAAAPTA